MSAIRVLIRSLWYAARFAGRPIHAHPSSVISARSILRANGGGSISIGAHCEIHDFAMILSYGGHIKIGDHCSINPFSIVYGQGGVEIGTGVRIAAHSVIIPANHIRGDDEVPSYRRGFTAKGIRIGDDVWIGSGCRILDGVTIGRHAVIGAGSVVVQSIADNVTAVGVPARPVDKKP